MHNPLFSIIVPLFNKSNYIYRCIKTILDQEFENFEIIIIDDGSTDDSPLIVKQCFYDQRIRLFQTNNQGVSAARNKGLDAASGEFILFIDADDHIESHYLKRIADEISHHRADIYIWGITKECNGKKTIIKPDISGMYYRDDFIHEMVEEQYNRHEGIIGYVSNKTFRRSFLRHHHIYFDTKINLMEDYAFYLNCYRHIHTAYFFDEVGYHYMNNPKATVSKHYHIDFASLIDTHYQCFSLVEKTINNSHDLSLISNAIGKLSLSMFLELRPVTYPFVGRLLYAIQQRPYCNKGLKIIQTDKPLLRQLLINGCQLSIYLYLKCRLIYLYFRKV